MKKNLLDRIQRFLKDFLERRVNWSIRQDTETTLDRQANSPTRQQIEKNIDKHRQFILH